MQVIAANDERFNYCAPQTISRQRPEIRLQRFTPQASEILHGQLGPLANLRSASGCFLICRSDSPTLTVHLARLRHHQAGPVGMDLEVEQADGSWLARCSGDLRPQDGDCRVDFATGLERGGPLRLLRLHLPLISTCGLSAIEIAADAQLAPASVQEPDWLAIGDSLTQGFSVQQPTQHWLHLLASRRQISIRNLGLGGVQIEPQLFAEQIAERPWQHILVGLGSNHAWRPQDLARVESATGELAELLDRSAARKITWALPPWKPCEDGQGPSEFWGVPLDRAAGERLQEIRRIMRHVLAAYPRLRLLEDLLPHDHHLYPDGLHPLAHGCALLASRLQQELSPSAA